MIDGINKDAKAKMDKSLDALNNGLTKLRTGRASPSLVENIMVDYYGSQTPLRQVATISVTDARTLMVSPWEKSLMQAVEKAIMIADLGLNPVGLGNAIKIPMPPLTEERRKDLIKLVKSEAENARVSIRSIRRDANSKSKELLKNKDISEDQEKSASTEIQKLTDSYIKSVETIMQEKEKDLMEI